MTRGVARIVTWQKPISFRSNGGWTQILLAVSLFTALLSALLAWLEVGTGGTLHVGAGTATAIAVGLAALTFGRTTSLDRRLMESEQRFHRVMEDSAIGVAVVGIDGRIVRSNTAFAIMLGRSREDVEGLTFREVTHPDDVGAGRTIIEELKAGVSDSFRFEKRYLRKDGTAVWALLSGSIIRDESNGQPIYIVSQIEDIDARRKSEALVTEAETRWNFALASAGQGVWEFDLRKGGTSYSATWVQMLGYAEGELDGDPDRWLRMIHPEDRAAVEEIDRAHLEGKTPFFEAEFRMRHKDGRWIWILDRGKAIERAEDGRLIRAIGSLTDITRRKEAEERLAISAAMLASEKERLRVTLQSIGDAVICTDASNRVTFMNPVAEKLTGTSSGTALGKLLGHVYWAVDEETGQRIGVARSVAGARAPAMPNSRAVLIRRDDTRCSIRQVVSPIINDRDEFCGQVIVFQDFTDARALQRQLAHAAAHDALTGLPNRSSFLRAMEELVDEVRNGGTEHQFMFVDLDHFKPVNDTGGHAAGDALLKQAAEALRNAVRQMDIVARLGGDEFAVVLKSTSEASARLRAQSIIEAIHGLAFTWEGRSYSIGASIGLTAISAGCGAVDEIIARADAGCYAAKAAGRGCVSMAPTGEKAGETVAPMSGSLAAAS